MLDIYYLKLKIKIEILQDCKLSKHKGYILMRSLKNFIFRSNCIKDGNCENCEFHNTCMVINTIDSKDGTGAPFIIECFDQREFFVKGDLLEFDVLLFGNAVMYLSQYIYTLDMMGEIGLQNKNKYRLIDVHNENGAIIYEDGFFYSENIDIKIIQDYVNNRKKNLNNIKSIEFIMPFRFLIYGELDDFLDLKDAINFIYQRIFTLNDYANNEIEKTIPNIKGKLGGEYREWADIKGIYEGKSFIKMGGVMGKVEFPMEINLIADYIVACELAHIGEHTSLGLGKFIIIEN